MTTSQLGIFCGVFIAAIGAQSFWVARAIDALAAHFEQRFAQIDRRFTEIDQRFDRVDQRLDRIERRVDHISDVLLHDLVERISRLEAGS